MKPVFQALILAAAILGIALLAAFDIIPEAAAQAAPLMAVAMFPAVWMGKSNCCNLIKRVKS